MTEWMRRIVDSKTIFRQQLAALPFAEKLRIIEQLRDRSLELAASPLRKEQHKKTDSCPEGECHLSDKRFLYDGPPFPGPALATVTYRPEFFQAELDLESDVFRGIRAANRIEPAAINESNPRDLAEIRDFFEANARNFHFLFADDGRLVGSILAVRNYIQCLSVARAFQRQGYGARLSMDCVNRLLAAGFRCVELDVLPGNLPAERLYRGLGFREPGG